MIKEKLPRAYLIEPRFKPVIGAVIMALKNAGISVEKELLDELEISQRSLADIP
ncbi:MAG: hypothetical protein J7K49_06060 [Thaumarchaeota archaeon]|nr:hypothetical protein [Nitrososphaerota archaeon]